MKAAPPSAHWGDVEQQSPWAIRPGRLLTHSCGSLFPPDMPQCRRSRLRDPLQGKQTTLWGTWGAKPSCRPAGEAGFTSDVLSRPSVPGVLRRTAGAFPSPTSTRTLSPPVISLEQSFGRKQAPAQGCQVGGGSAFKPVCVHRSHPGKTDDIYRSSSTCNLILMGLH